MRCGSVGCPAWPSSLAGHPWDMSVAEIAWPPPSAVRQHARFLACANIFEYPTSTRATPWMHRSGSASKSQRASRWKVLARVNTTAPTASPTSMHRPTIRLSTSASVAISWPSSTRRSARKEIRGQPPTPVDKVRHKSNGDFPHLVRAIEPRKPE